MRCFLKKARNLGILARCKMHFVCKTENSLKLLVDKWRMLCFEDRPMIAKRIQMCVDCVQDVWSLWRLEQLLLHMLTNVTYTANSVMILYEHTYTTTTTKESSCWKICWSVRLCVQRSGFSQLKMPAAVLKTPNCRGAVFSSTHVLYFILISFQSGDVTWNRHGSLETSNIYLFSIV